MEWFNLVDATYRSDLHDINELNFARFDAKLERRIAELDAKVEQRLGRLESKMDQRFAEVKTDILELLDKRLGSQTRLMLLTWATVMAAVIGIGLR